MNGWFSRAAIDRIAECAVSPRATEDPGKEPAGVTGALVLSRYAQAPDGHGLRDRHFSDPALIELFSDDAENAFAFYSFSGWLELAVSAGYVDLGAWDKTEELGGLVQTFLTHEAASETPADLTLLQELSSRLKDKRHRVEALHAAEFNAFASLLNLDHAVRNDVHVRTFLENCRSRQWHKDLAFLVTAGQFAAQLAAEARSDRTAGTIRGGLATLRAFLFFGDILDRVGKNEALAEGFIRGMTWVQQAANVHERISTWSERMTEWAVAAGEDEDAEAWRMATQTLSAIELRVTKVRPTPVTPPVISAAATIDDMISEGRIGGALRLAQKEAEDSATSLEQTEKKDEAAINAHNFLSACKRLDELGDTSRAAALLAPQFDRLRAHLHEVHMKDAAGILARARTATPAPPPPPPEQPSSAASESKIKLMQPLKFKHQSGGHD